MKVLITGAAGNLGSHVSRHLMTTAHQLRLLIHKSPLQFDTVHHSNIGVCRADLGQPNSLREVSSGVDCVVHFAGVLFAPLPERFLPKTNIGYVKNLVTVARDAGVRKFVLMSFPHVEGNTDPDHRATGRLDRPSRVVHFRTRLKAEKYLLEACKGTAMTPVVFRAGIVYGPEIKLVQAARWMLRHRLMAIWNKPTWAHLIALPDFLSALQAVIENWSAKRHLPDLRRLSNHSARFSRPVGGSFWLRASVATACADSSYCGSHCRSCGSESAYTGSTQSRHREGGYDILRRRYFPDET